MTERGTDGRRPRRRAALAVLAIIAALGVAIPALGAQEKALTIGPASTAGEGLTDLSGLTYAQAESRLTQLDEITLPLAIDGLESVQVSSVTLDSDDATRSLSLSGSATLPRPARSTCCSPLCGTTTTPRTRRSRSRPRPTTCR